MSSSDSVQEVLIPWVASLAEGMAGVLDREVHAGPPHEPSGEEGEEATIQGGVAFPLFLDEADDHPLMLVWSQHDAGWLADVLTGGPGKEPAASLSPQDLALLQDALQRMVRGLAGMPGARVGQGMAVDASAPVAVSLGMDASASRYLEFPLLVGEDVGLTLGIVIPEEPAAGSPSPPAAAPGTQAWTPSAGAAAREGAPTFAAPPPSREDPAPRLDVILDVPLELTVVLGKTSLLIQDLITIGEGSVLELDRMAGEPVELYVRDRLVALGEVIVIDERFGVKVLELVEDTRRAGARPSRPGGKSFLTS